MNLRSDLCIKLVRGNVDTRVNKLNQGEYDALILGYGGLKRLDLESSISQIFTTDEILPPACQASIGVQTIDENNEIKKVFIYPKKSKAMNLAFDVTPANM